MLTNQHLSELTNKLSKAIGSTLYVLDYNSADTLRLVDKQTAFTYRVYAGCMSFAVVMEDGEPLSKRELGLIKSFIEEYFKNEEHVISTNTEKIILRLFNEDLDRKIIEETLSILGLSTKKEIFIVLIKLHEKNSREDVISIIKNINSSHMLSAMTDKDVLAAVYERNSEESLDLAKKIVDIVESELLENIQIGISTLRKPYEIRTAYYEALDALNNGIKYQLPTNIYLYSDLMLYRLISYLSEKGLSVLYKEAVVAGFNNLGEDEIKTANEFINSNLNISEASRKLYIHRNTLIYRLDKIQKDTGLDIRIFNNAIKFKILLIIYRYMKNKGK